jgi:hypothetical protein
MIAAHRAASAAHPLTAAAQEAAARAQEGTEVSTGTAVRGGEDPGKSGAITAQQIISAQAAAGMSADRIAEHHHEVSASLFSGADTEDGQAFAREYDTTGESLLADLRAMERGPERAGPRRRAARRGPGAHRGAAVARAWPPRRVRQSGCPRSRKHPLQRAGRSPLHTRAADAVSGRCWRLTRTMPEVSASRDCQIGLARLPATVLGAGQVSLTIKL